MIAIICAMQEEMSHITDMKLQTPDGSPYPYAIDDKQNIAYVTSGIGKTNAAAACQWTIDTFHPRAIVNVGYAGSLDQAVARKTDAILASGFTDADIDLSGDGSRKGQTPNAVSLCSDDALSQKASSIASDMHMAVQTGKIATTDSFVADASRAKEIHDAFGCVACDMEASALSQICMANHTPFIAIKEISDGADESAEGDFDDNVQFGMKGAARLAIALADALCDMHKGNAR